MCWVRISLWYSSSVREPDVLSSSVWWTQCQNLPQPQPAPTCRRSGALCTYFGYNVIPPSPWILTSGVFGVPAGLSCCFLTTVAAWWPQTCCRAVQHQGPRQEMARQRLGHRQPVGPPVLSLLASPMSGRRTCLAVCHRLSPLFQHQCDAQCSVPAVLGRSWRSCSRLLIWWLNCLLHSF